MPGLRPMWSCDEECIAAKMRAYIEKPDLRKSLAEEGFKKVQKFVGTEQEYLRRYAESLNMLL